MRSPNRENLVMEIFALEGAQKTVLPVAALDARRVEHAATCEQRWAAWDVACGMCKVA
jgi:hypothetical protein